MYVFFNNTSFRFDYVWNLYYCKRCVYFGDWLLLLIRNFLRFNHIDICSCTSFIWSVMHFSIVTPGVCEGNMFHCCQRNGWVITPHRSSHRDHPTIHRGSFGHLPNTSRGSPPKSHTDDYDFRFRGSATLPSGVTPRRKYVPSLGKISFEAEISQKGK